MAEVIFLAWESPEGGYEARAVGEIIFTEADDLPQLRETVKDALRCHFNEGKHLFRFVML